MITELREYIKSMLPVKFLRSGTNFDFVRYRVVAFALSVVMCVMVCIMFFLKGLNVGIDFSGGILIEMRTSGETNVQELRELFAARGYNGAIIQNLGAENDFLIRVHPRADLDQNAEVAALKEIIGNGLEGDVQFRKIDYVGPKVGGELILDGIKALAVATIGMLIYIWIRFDWQFGVGAVISVLHDVIAVFAFFLISGYDFDLTSIAAILTVIGYSINDTVVIYDRIRENISKYKNMELKNIINLSVNETLSRSIMTVATTLIVCIALVLLGTDVLRGFSLALLFGILFGAYSSIYISAPVLLYTGLQESLSRKK